MKKLDMYKSEGKSKEPVRKTIQEITEELQKRLESQGIIPDSYFLSTNFRNSQNNAFPAGKVSGTISIGSGEVNAFLSIAGDEDPEQKGGALKGRIFITQFKTENGNTGEALKKASAALNLMLESFWVNTEADEKALDKQAEVHSLPKKPDRDGPDKDTENIKTSEIVQSSDPRQVAVSIQQALQNPDIAEEFKKLQQPDRNEQQLNAEESAKTITIPTDAKALTDEKVVNYFSRDSIHETHSTGKEPSKDSSTVKESDASKESSLKKQLINVDFTPEQAEVVIKLLEENQKKYEPKSSMFGLLGEVVGKMFRALNSKLELMIDSEKVIAEKLNSIHSAIGNEDYELFTERYRDLEQKIKYCHDMVCESAQGRSIQSTNILNHILNKEKVPVSIRTLQNAFVTAIDKNIESALMIYKYADENLHGEAHFDTVRGFLSHALNVLPDNEAERFINVSSIKAFDNSVIYKEMLRAEKYELFSKGLHRCENIDEYAPSLYYFAVQRRDADALHILAGKGASADANNGEALYTCFENNKLESAKILTNYGADIKILKDRIEQLQRSDPKYSLPESSAKFLKKLYTYCGLNQGQQSETVIAQDDIHGEDGDLGVHDGSW